MKSTGIEDISIDNSMRNDNKNGKSVLIVFLLILLIVFISLIIVYKYFLQKPIQTKQLFFDSVSNFNSKQIIDNSFYKMLVNRLLEEDATIDNNITYTSNREIDFIKDFNLDKFSLNSSTKTNINNKSFSTDVNINYSGNAFFEFNVLSNSENIGIKSNSIVNKYVGLSYNKLESIININNPLNSLNESQDIDISDSEFKKYVQKYLEFISNQIPDEKFSFKDNILLDGSYDNVSVKEYKLELSMDELKSVLVNTLVEVKNDEELLKKFLSTAKTINIEVRANNGEKNVINEPNEIVNNEETIINNTEDSNATDNNSQNNNIASPNDTVNVEEDLTVVDSQNDSLENQAQIDLEPNISLAESILPEGTEINLEEFQNNEKIQLEDIFPEISYEDSRIKNIIKLLLGKKINKNINSIQKEIDSLIDSIEKLEGNGIVLKIYVSENALEKVIATLPNNSDLEIEFHNNSIHDSTCKLTYLYKGDSGKFNFSDENEEEHLSIEKKDDLREELPIEDKKNGFSIELSRKENESQNSLGLVYNYIENEKINKKISFNINTTGNINSNTIKSEILIRNSGKEKDELIIENTIRFDENEEVPDFSEGDLLLLNELSEDEVNEVLQTLILQINKILKMKKDEIELIDTNNQKYVINRNFDNISSDITYEEAKNVLIDKISSMMREAIDNNEEFTLLNLENLTIDGYNVSSNVTEENATIVIDVYTFNINSNFELTDS